jgi:stage II sporulation protein M
MGLISFGTLGLAIFMGNLALVGGLLGGADLIGFSPGLLFSVGVLPHGLFEITAFVLATAAMLRLGAVLVTPNTEKSLGETFLLSVADWTKVFIGITVPLLAFAAVIEIYVTPVLIKMAIPYL